MRNRREQAVAHRFGLRLHHGLLCRIGQRGPLQRKRELRGKRFEQMRLLGQEDAPGVDRQHGEHAERRVRVRSRFRDRVGPRTQQRQISCGGRRQRVGTQPCRLAVILHPLRDRQIGAAQRCWLGRATRRRKPAGVIGHQHDHLGIEHFADVTHCHARHLLGPARGSEFAAHRIQQCRAPLAMTGNPCLQAHAGHELSDQQAHCHQHGEGDEVLAIGNVECVARFNEEEVERQDRECRGEHRRALTETPGDDDDRGEVQQRGVGVVEHGVGDHAREGCQRHNADGERVARPAPFERSCRHQE